MTAPMERAAKAIADSYFRLMDAPQTWETCAENFRRARREDAELALASAAEPTETMIDAMMKDQYREDWNDPHTINVRYLRGRMAAIWTAAHAAMMAERDERNERRANESLHKML